MGIMLFSGIVFCTVFCLASGALEPNVMVNIGININGNSASGDGVGSLDVDGEGSSGHDPCNPNPCGVNAECSSVRGLIACTCPTGYTGDPLKHCVRIDPCKPNPCGINAECHARLDKAICTCPNGYEGDPFTICTRVDPCEPNPCGINADCHDQGDNHTCTCPKGYEGNPYINCTLAGPCEPNPCGIDAYCYPQEEQHICVCPNGYKGNPLDKCTLRDPCQSNTCGVNANCFDHENSEICTCPFGYKGDPLKECTQSGGQDLPQDLFCFAASLRCHKFLLTTHSWTDSNTKCQELGLYLAEPEPPAAIPLKNYIMAIYGPNIGETWLGAKGNGESSRGTCCQQWTRRGTNLITNLWYDTPGNGVTLNCLTLGTSQLFNGSDKAYWAHRCWGANPVLCDLF